MTKIEYQWRYFVCHHSNHSQFSWAFACIVRSNFTLYQCLCMRWTVSSWALNENKSQILMNINRSQNSNVAKERVKSFMKSFFFFFVEHRMWNIAEFYCFWHIFNIFCANRKNCMAWERQSVIIIETYQNEGIIVMLTF